MTLLMEFRERTQPGLPLAWGKDWLSDTKEREREDVRFSTAKCAEDHIFICKFYCYSDTMRPAHQGSMKTAIEKIVYYSLFPSGGSSPHQVEPQGCTGVSRGWSGGRGNGGDVGKSLCFVVSTGRNGQGRVSRFTHWLLGMIPVGFGASGLSRVVWLWPWVNRVGA